MKKFLINILIFCAVPFLLIFLLYWLTDPFKVNKPFSLNNISTVNREYLSAELFFKQYPHYKYNSFVFSSSRGGGINTYVWKQLLNDSNLKKNDTISQFLFQSWDESITGISQKIKYLEKNKIPINNALILIDIGAFKKIQDGEKALSVKHYIFSGCSKLNYQRVFVQAYVKNPSMVISSIVDLLYKKPVSDINFDTISNDWNKDNKFNYLKEPVRNLSLDKSKFKERPKEEKFAEKEITPNYIPMLEEIKLILDKNKSNYKIIVTPSSNQLAINKEDVEILEKIFGKENVFNFSGKNYITEDKYNFTDINHFDFNVGWQILNIVYKNKNSSSIN